MPPIRKLALLGGLIAALATAAPSPAAPRKLAVGASESASLVADPVVAKTRMDLALLAGLDEIEVRADWSRGKTAPTADELASFQASAGAAQLDAIKLVIAVDTGGSRQSPQSNRDRTQFAQYAASLAQSLPYVRDFIVGNEPNLNMFWMPQFGAGGKDVAAPGYLQLLARTYDALKAVSPQIQVIGGALAPRGSDRPGTKRDTHSPTRFIEDLGAAYKASGRTKPVMDAFAIHPYMRMSKLSPTETHAESTTITLADYPELVALLDHAFAGTAQRGGDIPIYYTEFGVQTHVLAADRHAYTEVNSPSAGDAVSPDTQAHYYREALALSACQPTVKGIFIFHTFDEIDLAGWQSGLYYADHTAKASLPLFRRAVSDLRNGKLTACRPG